MSANLSRFRGLSVQNSKDPQAPSRPEVQSFSKGLSRLPTFRQLQNGFRLPSPNNLHVRWLTIVCSPPLPRKQGHACRDAALLMSCAVAALLCSYFHFSSHLPLGSATSCFLEIARMSASNDIVTLVEMPYSAATSKAPSLKDGQQTPSDAKTVTLLTESDLIDYTLYLPPRKVALIVVSLGLSFFLCVLE